MLVDSGGGGMPTSISPTGSTKKSVEKGLINSSPALSQHSSPLKQVLRGTIEKNHLELNSSPLKAAFRGSVDKNHLDKPIDVEARLANTPPHVLIRSISSLSHQSIRPRTPETEHNENLGVVPAMRKGILMQARDRLFSRWKERYFVLTKDYLACFRRGSTKYSEMGSFIFKINLASVDSVGWEDRRGGPVLSICLPREGKMLLRAKAGLDQWYRDLRETTTASRNRRNALRRGSSTTHLNHLSNLHSPQPFKSGSNLQFSLSDSTPEIVQLCESVCRESSPGATRNISRPNRFSLMTNIEVGSCEGDMTTPPSSVNSSHKFSSSTSSTSGSGGSSSLASSPSLRGSTPWARPSSPIGAPARSRFSLYEGPREAISSAAKTRHSVCVEPRGLHADIVSVFRRRATPNDSAYRGSRTSLCLQPRNPLLDLLESADANTRDATRQMASPAKSEPDARLSRDSPLAQTPSSHLRPRAQSTSDPNKTGLGPRSRTNLALFRHSAIFN